MVSRTHQRNARSANLSAPPLMRVQMYNKVILVLKKKGKHYFMNEYYTLPRRKKHTEFRKTIMTMWIFIVFGWFVFPVDRGSFTPQKHLHSILTCTLTHTHKYKCMHTHMYVHAHTHICACTRTVSQHDSVKMWPIIVYTWSVREILPTIVHYGGHHNYQLSIRQWYPCRVLGYQGNGECVQDSLFSPPLTDYMPHLLEFN